MNTFDRDAVSGAQSPMTGYSTSPKEKDRTDLEVILDRIASVAGRAQSLKIGMYDITGRLKGEAAVGYAGEEARDRRAGLLGDANDMLDDLEAALTDCAGILQTLRGLV